LFDLTWFGLYLIDPQYFWILTTMSATMVGIALILYHFTRPDRYPSSHSHYQPIPEFDDDQSYKIQS